MLRESISLDDQAPDLTALTDPDCRAIPGIAHSDLLIALADAFMGGDAAALAAAREALATALGEAAMVDAIAVAANFQRMVRIADGTGIPSDSAMLVMAGDLPRDLGLDRYGSAGNTPAIPLLKRWLLRLVAVPQFRRMIRRASGR